jgi:hypothetical protein
MTRAIFNDYGWFLLHAGGAGAVMLFARKRSASVSGAMAKTIISLRGRPMGFAALNPSYGLKPSCAPSATADAAAKIVVQAEPHRCLASQDDGERRASR